MDSSPIPLIALEDTAECAGRLLEAAQTLGFVYIAVDGSGIPPEKIDGMFELASEFFDFPQEEKARYKISENNKGWVGTFTENLGLHTAQKRGDIKEAFNIAEFRDSKPQQPLPPPFATHTSQIAEFHTLCQSLCQTLLHLFARALKIDPSSRGEDYFTPLHTPPSSSILRLLMYPLPPPDYNPSTDIRAGAHSDYGSVTLLFQRESQTGLEILTKGGGWAAVPVVPNAICVNIGDLLSFWTAGLLRSTVHRVVVPKGMARVRYSMAYFCHPADETLLEPIPSEVVRARGQRGANDEGRKLNALEHLKKSLAAGYGWKESLAGT